MLKSIALAGAVALFGAASAQATVIFADNFDGDTNAPSLNASLDQWIVDSGTVDLIGSGSSGTSFDFYPGNGYYVDMDGSTRVAGTMTTRNTLNLLVGHTYRLSFDYGNNKDSNGNETLTYRVFHEPTDASMIKGDIEINGAIANLIAISFDFVATHTTGLLRFSAAGGDNGGPILDNVILKKLDGGTTAVPLPATGLLLVGALGALGLRRRRKA